MTFTLRILPLVLLLAACGGSPMADALTKDEARGKTDYSGDVCTDYGWYMDGVCDSFCPQPDPDCCTATCASRDMRMADGWCFDSEDCTTFCEANTQDWPGPQAQAFDACVADAPLCFQTAEQCVNGGSVASAFCTESCVPGSSDCLTSEDCLSHCSEHEDEWHAQERASFSTCVQQPLCFRTLDQCVSPPAEPTVCEARCDSRDSHMADGWCFHNDECVAFCEAGHDAWTTPESAAFDTCVSEAPLCFRTAQNCIDEMTTATPTLSVCEMLCGDGSECFSSVDCVSHCEMHIEGWNEAEQGIFDTCAAQPLCFQTVDQCMRNTTCSARCESRDTRRVDGWCFDSDECTAFCQENQASWTPLQSTAFDGCTSDAPLCFRTMADCIG